MRIGQMGGFLAEPRLSCRRPRSGPRLLLLTMSWRNKNGRADGSEPAAQIPSLAALSTVGESLDFRYVLRDSFVSAGCCRLLASGLSLRIGGAVGSALLASSVMIVPLEPERVGRG